DIEDEFDLPDTSIERVDDTHIRIEGTYTIDDFNEEFGTELEHEDFNTMAGLVFGALGRAAEVGDEVKVDGLCLRVNEIEGSRILKLEVEFTADDETPTDEPAAALVSPMGSAGGSAFRHRDFSLFWVSLVAEALALQMAVVAIGWQVYSISGSALDLGLIGLAEFLPLLLLALPAGHLADRLPRRNLLTVMASLNVVVLAGLLVVTIRDTGHVWPFFALAFVQGIG